MFRLVCTCRKFSCWQQLSFWPCVYFAVTGLSAFHVLVQYSVQRRNCPVCDLESAPKNYNEIICNSTAGNQSSSPDLCSIHIYLYTKVHSVTPHTSPAAHTAGKQNVKVYEWHWLIKSLSANTLSLQIPCTRTSVQAVCEVSDRLCVRCLTGCVWGVWQAVCEVLWMTGTQSVMIWQSLVYFIGCCFTLSQHVLEHKTGSFLMFSVQSSCWTEQEVFTEDQGQPATSEEGARH